MIRVVNLTQHYGLRAVLIDGSLDEVLQQRLLIDLHVALPLVAFVTVFLVVLLALGMGPTLSVWRLTGKYRLIFTRPGNGWEQL